MGMNHFGEMHRLSRMVRPTHCVFTNIGVAHLEYLGSREGILKAKTEMLDYAAENAGIFINGEVTRCVDIRKCFYFCEYELVNISVDDVKRERFHVNGCF